MKSYLDLIPISARVHKRRSRMTLFCVAIAVFLVTAVFSMADMAVRLEREKALLEYGNWHILLKRVPEETLLEIGRRDDVASASRYDVANYRLDEEYWFEGKKAAVMGADPELAAEIMPALTGTPFPGNPDEAVLTGNARDSMGVRQGDTVTLDTPGGSFSFTVAGFMEDASVEEYDAVGFFLNMEDFRSCCSAGEETTVYYIQFKAHADIRRAISDIKAQYGLNDDTVVENTELLMTMGLSGNSYVQGIYYVAAVLFVLVLLAGVLMIAGSISSNIAQRTRFFGMLRCIGASRKQIMRMVRLEALSWCKTAIPAGVLAGVAATWGLCAILRYGVGGDFAAMPVYGVSIIGIVSGVIMGFLSVWIAAQSPAKKAAKVSPLAAVSGNQDYERKNLRAFRTPRIGIEHAMGIHHAVSARKNLVLLTGSFALSIVLFLSFTAVLQWVRNALPAMRPYSKDLAIYSDGEGSSIDKSIVEQLTELPEVKRAFGRMYTGDVAVSGKEGVDAIDLLSYESWQFAWAKEDVAQGDLESVCGETGCVAVVYDREHSLELGQILQVGEKQLKVTAVLETSPFKSEDTPTVICSEQTYEEVMGSSGYAIVDVQLKNPSPSADIDSIRRLVGDGYKLTDRRQSNEDTRKTYWAFHLFVYGFLAVIALITVFNIINSISMSVSARIRQYGIMRAVGTQGRQIMSMIAAEAAVYAGSGMILGCVLGLLLHRAIFRVMITSHWGIAWSVPLAATATVLLLVGGSTVLAVYYPSRRIREMVITEVINEL